MNTAAILRPLRLIGCVSGAFHVEVSVVVVVQATNSVRPMASVAMTGFSRDIAAPGGWSLESRGGSTEERRMRVDKCWPAAVTGATAGLNVASRRGGHRPCGRVVKHQAKRSEMRGLECVGRPLPTRHYRCHRK